MATDNERRKRVAHVVSHTHWDREWRYPIWETRQLLVDFIDELIEVLETGAYPSFLLDGQAAPILDYLEIRPANEERVRALVADRRLLIGPWLTLPDEYPVDGEAMVRNLLWGDRAARALGGVLKAGYTPFGWGQTAQLPQIYAGFGIDVAMIGKRVSTKRAPQAEFVWKGPDGAELLATRFGVLGRQNFYFKIHLTALFGLDHMGPDWFYRWEDGGVAFHRADPERMEQDHAQLRPPTDWHPEVITPELVEETWRTTDDSVLADDRLMMNGCDYTAAQPMFPEMLARVNEVDTDPDREWIHTTLPAYLEVMRRKIDRDALPVVEGELRDGPAGPLTGNALTTRSYLKRLNRDAQHRLIRFAEPMTAVAALDGAEYPDRLLRLAWDYLLKSHPHDSINGVTQDKTASDVEHRLRQVVEIAEAAGSRALQHLVGRIDTSGSDPGDVLVIAFNPLPFPRRGVVEAWINVPDLPPENRAWPFDPRDLQIADADGAPRPTQWAGKSRAAYPVTEIHTRAFPFNCERHRVFFDTGEVPACGYRVYRATLRDESEERAVAWSGADARTGTLLPQPNVLENEHLRIEMNPNGTFDLVAKDLDRRFAGLAAYEDRGEHGEYWINRRPMFDQVHASHGCDARIWAEDHGPLRATLVSEVVLRIPRRGDRLADRRGDEIAELAIRTAVTLAAGSPRAEVEVSFDNRHEDHFLRTILPTGIAGATHVDAGGHFIVDRRPVRPQGPSDEAVWPDMATQPMNGFVDLSDGEVGLAVLSSDIGEYGTFDDGAGTIALSLLRSVHNWICTETRVGSIYPGQKGGQCLGEHRLRYGLQPHRGGWREATVPAAADAFAAPFPLVQTRRNEGDLPADAASLFAVEGDGLRLSALKREEDGDDWVVRVYNPGGAEETGRIRFARRPVAAREMTLNEEPGADLELDGDGALSVTVAPYRILTVAFRFEG